MLSLDMVAGNVISLLCSNNENGTFLVVADYLMINHHRSITHGRSPTAVRNRYFGPQVIITYSCYQANRSFKYKTAVSIK
jgi:hypothetical protein